MVPLVLVLAVAGIFAGEDLRALAVVGVVAHGAAVAVLALALGRGQEPVLVAIEVLVDEVGLQAAHGLPSLLKHLALAVGAAGAHDLNIRILGADGLHEDLQTVVVEVVPLLVADADELQVEGCGVAHLGALLAPFRVDVAIGKLDEVEAVLDVGVELVHRGVGVGSVLELAGQSDAQHGQRLGADVLREEEELIEAESVRLVVVCEVAIVERVLPAVAVGGSVLDRADGVLPLVAGVERGALDDAAAGEAEDAGVDVLESLGQVAAQAVLAALIRVDGEERDVLQTDLVGAGEEDAQLGLRLGAGRLQDDFILLPVCGRDVELLLDELLALLHRAGVDELHADL